MRDWLINRLETYPYQTIRLGELEKLAYGSEGDDYSFTKAVLELEDEGILEMVKKNGRTSSMPSIAYRYRIKRERLLADYRREIQRYELLFHAAISLDRYYALSVKVWKEDLPYLKKINAYLKENGLPHDTVPAPERSYELTGNEKWITELNGKECLERIGLWEQMKMFPVSDPLMFAVNPNQFTKSEHQHLIVENKTTYEGLLNSLLDTHFTTLIYGSGKKIVKSIEHFNRQLPLKGVNHVFYYFGDLDREGIQIWYSLQRKVNVYPALPFYYACLEKDFVKGKSYQRTYEEAFQHFLSFFSPAAKKKLIEMFKQDSYYPQEALKTAELQQIWRESEWNFML